MPVIVFHLRVVAPHDTHRPTDVPGCDLVYEWFQCPAERALDRLDGKAGRHLDWFDWDENTVRIPIPIVLDCHLHDRLCRGVGILRS